MRTIIGVCLDESGSMGEQGKRDAAISAFNEYLHEQQRNKSDECLMAIARFNTIARVTQKVTPIEDVPDLTEKTYIPSGSTALFDAIAYTVREIERGLSSDDRVVCVVLTDGEENSSRETTIEQVKELLKAKEATGNWTFVYLSASPDAFAQGRSYGFAPGNVGQYANTGAGVSHAVAAMSVNTSDLRASGLRASRNMGHGVSGTSTTPEQKTPLDNDMWGTK